MKVLTCSLQSSSFRKDFINSLLDTGFAVITDHNLPKKDLEQFYKDWTKIFSNEPMKELFRYDKTIQAGYFPFKSEKAKDSPYKDLKEFFHFYGHNPASLRYTPYDAHNSTVLLFRRLEDLGIRLLQIIEEETPSQYHNNRNWGNAVVSSPSTLLRILHYPPVFSNGLEVRAAAHEDINLITLLPVASAPGLQVLDSSGTWHEIGNAQNDAIIVNIGDMLQELTYNYYKSTTHRVVNPEGEAAKKSRYSAPLFVHPRPDYRLSVKYTAGEFLNERLKELGLK